MIKRIKRIAREFQLMQGMTNLATICVQCPAVVSCFQINTISQSFQLWWLTSFLVGQYIVTLADLTLDVGLGWGESALKNCTSIFVACPIGCYVAVKQIRLQVASLATSCSTTGRSLIVWV